MCDPISIGLTLAGGAISAYGQGQVARAQKRDIAQAGQKYQEERTKQAGLTGENEATVGKTLDLYGKPNQDKMMGDAIGSRQTAYTAPIQAKNFVADMPADFDPNNVVAGRNAYTGKQQQASSIGEALAKAKLDAYGDVQTKSRIGANENNQAIDMVRRIQSDSAAAAGQQQAVLPSKLKADQGAGATAGAIGDLFTLAGSLTGMAGGLGNFSGSIPGVPSSLDGVMAARYGNSIQGTGLLGGLEKGFNYISPFGGTAAPSFAGPMQAPISRLVHLPSGY